MTRHTTAPDSAKGRSLEKQSQLRRLMRAMQPWRSRVWLASFCSILNKIFDLAPPVLIGAAVDIVVKKEDSWIAHLGVVDVMDQLVVLAVVTVAIWALESVFEYAYSKLWRELAQTVEHDLRMRTYGHIQNLEMAFFHDKSTGNLMSILNDDINQLERFLDDGANDLLQVATTAIVICTAFFVLAPSVAWMAMLPIPFVIWGSFKFQHLLAPRYAAVRDRVGRLNGHLSNNLTGIATIKSYTTEDFEVGRIGHESREYMSANKRAIALSAAFSPLIRMAIVVGFAATLVYGGHLALNDELAVGTYSVLIFLTQRLLWPLTRIGRTFDTYQRAMASTKRVLDLLQTPVQILSGDVTVAAKDVRGDIRFEDVDFGYRDREPLLKDFNLYIPAGSTVGIVGATGSGKTSLINLLLRFHEVQDGRITIDGMDISKWQLSSLRDAIGLVSQHVYLFRGSVRENISYGTFDATDAEIEDAAKAAEVFDFIKTLPKGFDTTVGERGERLSGGQRQRLSIARAVLKDPPILILDEATSAVDNETEALIQRSLAHIAASRTTIVIAHRLSTIRNADQIVVMNQGKIVEKGTHEELVALGGKYASLWAVQTGDRERLTAA